MPAAVRRHARRLLERLGLLGVAFRVHERLKARAAQRRDPAAYGGTGPDGLPVPSAQLMVLVGGETNAAAFLQGGAHTAQTIRDVLAAHGADVARLRALLDFGCGCGRVMRQWRPLAGTVALHGTDYNPELIAWCRTHLPFAEFGINQLAPPLAYADGAFDLVYAFSVFTHLPEALQQAWLDELVRVLAPGGWLFLTLHGDSFRSQLLRDERARYDAGELVVRHAGMAGSNLCAAFHPRAWLERVFGQRLAIVAHLPERLGQDVVLLRKE